MTFDGAIDIVCNPFTEQELRNCRMTLTFADFGQVESNTDEYIFWAPQIIEYISRFITLFPGDVVTLGRTSAQLDLPLDCRIDQNAKGEVVIHDLGNCVFDFSDLREPRQTGQIEYHIGGADEE